MQNQTYSTEQQLIYLKGFLDCLAATNSFCDDGKTYYVVLLDKIDNSFEQTIRKHLDVKKWKINTEVVEKNWREVLTERLFSFFDQIVFETVSKTEREISGSFEKERKPIVEKILAELKAEDFHSFGHLIMPRFIQFIEDLVINNVGFYLVDVDWTTKDDEYEGFYECYQADFLFDLNDKILFLHFGGSD